MLVCLEGKLLFNFNKIAHFLCFSWSYLSCVFAELFLITTIFEDAALYVSSCFTNRRSSAVWYCCLKQMLNAGWEVEVKYLTPHICTSVFFSDHSDMLCLMHILLMLCCFVPVLVNKMLFTQHLYLHLYTELRNTSVRNKPKISILYLCSRPCEKYLYFCKCYLVLFNASGLIIVIFQFLISQ